MRTPDLRHIDVSVRSDGVALATLNRPDKLNALTFEMFDEVLELGRWINRSDEVRATIITGSGRAFCAGLDLGDAARLPDLEPGDMLRQQEHWATAITSVCKISKPVIAAVNGPAAGAGFALALAADVRICSPDARFNAAFVRIGLSGGDCGTSWTLPRIVGFGIASEILLTGRFVEADEAHRVGLVNRVVPADLLVDEAHALARQITANSPFGVRLTKSVLNENVDAPSLEAALEIENRNQVLASRSGEMVEALTAFLEKRPAVFKSPALSRSEGGPA